MHARRPPDRSLLCESCGYPIADLPASSTCPECGRPIADSLPANRTGSPWQVAHTPVSWAATIVQLVRSPRAAWATVAIDTRTSYRLTATNIALATLLLAATFALPAGINNNSPEMWISLLVTFPLALAALTAVEWAGLRFFGRRRKWRTTSAISLTVCAHASYGWIAAAALMSAAWHLSFTFSTSGPAALRSVPLPPGITRSVFHWPILLPVLGFTIGLTAFEILVYLGFNKLRFANAPTPAQAFRSPHPPPAEHPSGR